MTKSENESVTIYDPLRLEKVAIFCNEMGLSPKVLRVTNNANKYNYKYKHLNTYFKWLVQDNPDQF